MQTIKQLPKTGFSILQVLLNILFFCGGLLIGIVIISLLGKFVDAEPETLGYGALTIGGMIGALFATRCSPRPIWNEVGAAVLVMAVLGHVLIRSGGNGLFSESHIWITTARLGCPSVLGILVGTLLGLRHHGRFRGRIDSGWRWSGISLLMAAGVLLVGCFALLLVSEIEATGGTVVLACFLGALVSGGITQLLAPVRNFRACGSGAVWIVALFFLIGLSVNTREASRVAPIIGGVILCGITFGLGSLGAFLAYRIAGRDEVADFENISQPLTIPSAQAVERSEG